MKKLDFDFEFVTTHRGVDKYFVNQHKFVFADDKITIDKAFILNKLKEVCQAVDLFNEAARQHSKDTRNTCSDNTRTTGLNFWEAYQAYKQGKKVKRPDFLYTINQEIKFNGSVELLEESFDATDWEIVG